MHLFNNPKSVLYLTRSGFQLYFSSGTSAKFDFPESLIDDLEIKDNEKLANSLGEFLKTNNFGGGDLIFVLSDEVLFQKEVKAIDDIKQQEEIKGFISKVPFDPEKIARKTVRSSDKLTVFVTNKNLYEEVKQVFDSLGFKVTGVIPGPVFGIAEETISLDPDQVKQILKSGDLLKIGNFLTVESNQKMPIYRNQKLLLVFSVGLIFTALLLGGFALGIVKVPGQESELDFQEAVTSAQEEASFEARPEGTQEAVELDREGVTIQVLNGSGIAGQANDVREIFFNLGYSNIEIENAPISDNVATTVKISPDVDEAIRNEIIEKLESMFGEVVVEESKAGLDFDLLITTGRGQR